MRPKDRLGEQLAKQRTRLSPGLLNVAEFIDGHRHRALELSALEIGFENSASDATVIHAIQLPGLSVLIEQKDVIEALAGLENDNG